MRHDPSSFKQVAVLTGLTALIGGAEISNADAATTSETDTFTFSFLTPGTQNLSFNGFNASGVSGVLTGVTLQLGSAVFLPPLTSATTSVELFGNPFPSSPNPVPFNNATSGGVLDFNNFTLNGVSGTATLADYLGSFNAVLKLTATSVFSEWLSGAFLPPGSPPEGLTVTYTYTPAVPLPATLPLFAGGLAGLGFLTWRSRRKQTAKE